MGRADGDQWSAGRGEGGTDGVEDFRVGIPAVFFAEPVGDFIGEDGDGRDAADRAISWRASSERRSHWTG